MTILRNIIRDINSTNLTMLSKKIFRQIHYFSSGENQITSYRTTPRIENPTKYKEYFLEMYESHNYFSLLNDISILAGYYKFSRNNNDLIEASLEYLPNPGFMFDRELKIEDEEIEEVMEYPLSFYTSNYIRFDFNITDNIYKPLFHPCSHLHMGVETEYRMALNKFPFFSEFVKLILFYNYSEQWRKLIPRIDTFEKPIDSNLDFTKYLRIRIRNKSSKFIQSELEPFEEEHHIFNI